MIVTFTILGLAVIVLGVLAAISNARLSDTNQASSRWKVCYRWRRAAGAVLAIAGVFVTYSSGPAGETYRYLGFPFLVSAIDPQGHSYSSALSGPCFLANAMFSFQLAQAIIWLLARVWREPSRGPRLSVA